MPRFAWFRQGSISVHGSATATDTATAGADGALAIHISPLGLDPSVIGMTGAGTTAMRLPAAVTSVPHLAVSFAKGKVGVFEAGAKPPSLAAIEATIAAARKREYGSYQKCGEPRADLDRYLAAKRNADHLASTPPPPLLPLPPPPPPPPPPPSACRRYGEFADVKEAVQAATMWNYIYTPAEYAHIALPQHHARTTLVLALVHHSTTSTPRQSTSTWPPGRLGLEGAPQRG